MTNAYQVYTAARQLLEGYTAAMQLSVQSTGRVSRLFQETWIWAAGAFVTSALGVRQGKSKQIYLIFSCKPA